MIVLKASDPDATFPLIFREGGSEQAPCLVRLYYLYLNISTLPQCWKLTYFQPILKEEAFPTFLPIAHVSLACILPKIFESLLISRLFYHLAPYSLFFRSLPCYIYIYIYIY